MDLERRAKKLVGAAKELVPALRKSEQVAELGAALLLFGRGRADRGRIRKTRVGALERHFLIDAVALTLDRRNSLWLRSASWALFFLARGLYLSLQNYKVQAAKQIKYAEEELQLGASAKAMVFARGCSTKRKSKSTRAKTRARRVGWAGTG